MSSDINPSELYEWCKIPPDELPNHPNAKVKIRILKTKDDVYRDFAQTIYDEIKSHNKAGKPTRLILPCGPRGEYPYLVKMINETKLSLKNVHAFQMDECLDWQGRPIHTDHPMSFTGWMYKNFYHAIDKELQIPSEQIHFPDPFNIEKISEEIQKVGGIDTVYGGVGYRGHIAYNEPPDSRWYVVSKDEFRNSKTRILNLNDDTLIALSQRAFGGCSYRVPPMAITLGMKDILSAKRIRLYSETGSWKQTIIRILLFGPVTTEYPVTFCQEHHDCVITIDKATAECPELGM
jgi:glucosamine-6-phosphate deaminase